MPDIRLQVLYPLVPNICRNRDTGRDERSAGSRAGDATSWSTSPHGAALAGLPRGTQSSGRAGTLPSMKFLLPPSGLRATRRSAIRNPQAAMLKAAWWSGIEAGGRFLGCAQVPGHVAGAAGASERAGCAMLW